MQELQKHDQTKSLLDARMTEPQTAAKTRDRSRSGFRPTPLPEPWEPLRQQLDADPKHPCTVI